jgi:hypothetical protein
MASARSVLSRPPRKRVAEGRMRHAPERPDPAEAQRQRQIVERLARGRPSARPDAENAVIAAGDLVPLIGDRPDDLRRRQRQHGEIDARAAHAEPPHQRRAEPRDDRAEQERGHHPEPAMVLSSAAP